MLVRYCKLILRTSFLVNSFFLTTLRFFLYLKKLFVCLVRDFIESLYLVGTCCYELISQN